MRGSTFMPTPRPISLSVHAMVAPPITAAATLSGCPSSSVPISIIASFVNKNSPPRTSERASAKPPTIAAADEPSPRPCGITFNCRSAIPRDLAPLNSRDPICSNPRIMAFITRLLRSFLISSLPSPLTSTSNSFSSKICAA